MVVVDVGLCGSDVVDDVGVAGEEALGGLDEWW